MPLDAFISYQSGDLREAELVHTKLVEAGFNVWFDKARLNPGCDWHREIEAGCEDSRVVLPILTPGWQTSEWTKFETYGAEAVIPLLFGGTFEDVAPVPLRRFQAETIDCEDGVHTDWSRLFDAIRAKLAQPMPEKAPRVASLRYAANPYFVGREKELLAICEALHRQPTALLTQGAVEVVTALGGVGKTTLARQYAEKFWRLYPQMFWVDCRAPIDSQFARIAEILVPELRGLDIKDADKAARGLYELNSSATRLLILDNADDEESIQQWIPNTGGCRTLITSRFTAWSDAIQTLHVYVLEPEPARDFLCRRTGRDPQGGERAACDELAKALGYLPLALTQAAAYIREQGEAFRFRQYLTLYAEATQELLAKRVLGSTKYPDSVMTTWKTSIAKMPPEARSILRLSSFLAPTPIPVQMFVKGAAIVRVLADEFPSSASPVAAASDEFHIREGLGALTRYSLIDSDGEQFGVHALVQKVERIDAGAQCPRCIEQVGEILAAYAPEEADEFENWPVWNTLLPHAQILWEQSRGGAANVPATLLNGLALTRLARGEYGAGVEVARDALVARERVLGSEHPDTLTSVNNLALLLMDSGEYAEVEPLYRRALAAQERALGAEHPDTLSSVNNLALLLNRKGEYAEAELLCRRALAARERVSGVEHPATLQSVSNLAVVLNSKGACAEAETLCRRALAARERLLGVEHPDTLTSVNNLAVLLKSKGEYAEAELLFRRALAASEQVPGAEHPDTLRSVSNLALLLWAKGEYEEAEALCRVALAAEERVLGPDHPSTITSVNNLALVLEDKGACAEAEALYRRALAASERVVGPDHHDTAICVNNLACLLMRRGEDAEAEALYRRALAAEERALGPNHPSTLTSVRNLAVLLDRVGKCAEAEPLFRRALAASERGLGPEHPDTLTSVNNLAGLLAEKGEYAEAESLLRRTLAARERIVGREQRDTLTTANDLAVVLESEGEYAEAEALYRRALAGYERVLGPDHPDALASVNNLGVVLARKGEWAEAEPLLKRAVAGRDRALGPDHPDTQASVNNLAGQLQQQGRIAEAEPLYRRMLAGYERQHGPDHPQTALASNQLGVCLRTLGRPAEAEPLQRQYLRVEEATHGANDPWLAHPLNTLAVVLAMQGKLGEARALLARAWRLKAAAHDNISCRVLWTGLAAAMLAGEPPELFVGLLKSLLSLSTLPTRSDVAPKWDIAPVVDFLRPQLARADADLLAALAEALNDRTQLRDLEAFPVWRDPPPLPLDTPWPPDAEDAEASPPRSGV